MTSFYDQLVAQDQAQPAPAPAPSFYDSLKQQDAEEGKLRASVSVAVQTSPDKAAKHQYLSKVTGLPLAVVQTNEGEAQARAKFQEINELAKTSPVLRERLMNPEFTAVAQNDVGTLASIGDTFFDAAKYITSATDKGPTLLGHVRDLGLGATVGVGKTIFDVAGFAADLAGGVVGSSALENVGRVYREQADRAGSAMSDFSTQSSSSTGKAIVSGLQSAGTNIAMLPLGIERAAAGFAGQAGHIVAGVMGLGVGADAYNEKRSAGGNQGQSLAYGIPQGAFEYLFESIPAGKLFHDLAGGAGALKAAIGQIVPELYTEQLTTVAQDFNTWVNMHPEKTLKDFIEERPEAAYQTLVATLVGIGAQAGAIKAITSGGQRMSGAAEGQQRAQASAEQMQKLLALANQSMLRTNSPQTFAELSQEMAEKTEGAPTEVRFDARTLGEVLNQEDLAKLPSIAPQLQEAIATGGEVSVPIGELMANVAGTPLEQKLTEHMRVGDNELSAFEAKEAQAQAESYLQSESERVIREAVDSTQHQASHDAVLKTFMDQFEKLGRFTPDVNQANAAIAAAMYTSLGARLGMTPEQAYAAHPISVAGVNPATQEEVLNANAKPGEMTVDGYHYSPQDRNVLSTEMYGTGLKGSARDEIMGHADQRLRNRLSFYFDKGTGIRPEDGVGGRAHRVQLSGVYDSNADPLKLRSADARAFESKLLDLGYTGYLDRMDGTQPGQVVMLGKQTFTPEKLGAVSRIETGQRVAPLADAAPQWQTQATGTPEQLQAKMERMQAMPAWKGYDLRIADGKLQVRKKDEVLNQSHTLRSGEETLAAYGLPPGGKYNTRDIAAALEARQREKWGKIDPTDRSEEAATKIANWMAEEVRFEMQHPRKSGVGWYSYKFQRALDTFAEVFPELKKDKDARATLTALIAITSDGQKVVPNFRMAVDLYGNFRKTGKFTTERGHARMDSIQGNVELLQKMLDDMGPKAMRKYLLQEATVTELRKRAKAEGVEFKTDYQAHIKLPMAAVTFGPKLGAFYANLMGAHGYLTMDRWWSRTFNRYRGTLLQAPTKDALARIKELLGHPEWSDDEAIAATVEPRKSYEAKNFKNGTELEKAANTVYKAAFENLEDAPFNATDRTFMLDAVAKAQQILDSEGRKISVADIQAVLWYYEKRLYGELGARQTADVSYEDAAKKVVAERADTGANGRSDARGTGQGASNNDAGATPGVSEEAVTPGLEPFEPGSGELSGTDTYQQSGNGSGRQGARDLTPLEGAPSVPGFHGPDPSLVAVAEQYARDNGITLKRQDAYVKVDPERAKRIADAYEAMAHNPQDPAVKEAYENLIRQTMAQYQALVKAGYKFWFIDLNNEANQAYASTPWNAMRDVRANKQMGVFPTAEGFGTKEDFSPDANPLLADTGIKWPMGGPDGPLVPVLANDLFRAVHDAFGHGLEGAGFRADGEENAWQAHSRLFTGSALGAITTETRGQNSWLNFGPHGEANRTAKVEDTVFADQKTGLLPEWAWTEGRAGNMGENKYQAKYLAGRDVGSLNQEERAQYEALSDLFPDTFADAATTVDTGIKVSSKGDTLQGGNVNSASQQITATKQGLQNFWKWFGQSEAVDDSGKPLILYHSTNADTDVLKDNQKTVNNYGLLGDVALTRSGIFLTPERAFSQEYLREGGGQNVMQLYARLEQPLDLRSGISEEVERELVAAGISSRWLYDYRQHDWEMFDNADDGSNHFVDTLKHLGYDGAIFNEEGKDGKQHETYVVFDGAQLKSATGNQGTFDPANPSILAQPAPKGPRATFSPSTMTISLLEGADLSSFHHEMAHFYLEVLANIASQPNAPASIVGDMDILLKWFGVKDLQTWNAMSLAQKRDSHEKFAEHYEQYLFQGKAPSQELQPLFRRFASWMKNVYQSLQAFMLSHDSNLTPEVRGVYDRMLATEQQIAETEQARKFQPLFKSAEEVGMDPAQWAAYQVAAQEASESAIENLQARSLRDLKWSVNARSKTIKAMQKAVNQKVKEVTAEVTAEVEAMPEYAAKAYLDGLGHKPTDGELQLASEQFGFSSPDEMLRAIMEAQPKKTMVEGMADQRLLERYGDMVTPEGIEAAANEAVHNEARARFVADELRALSEGMRLKTTDRSTILEKLKECIGS